MGTAINNTAPIIVGKRYELLQPLGSGGMGTVFQAKDRLTGSDVALKLVNLPADQALLRSRDGTPGFDLALAQEFRALATIRHPHIISVYDSVLATRGSRSTRWNISMAARLSWRLAEIDRIRIK